MDELLGANTDTLDRMAESLALDARTLHDIRTRGRQVVAEIEAAWNGPDLWHLTQQWEQQGLPQLANASTSLETCASQLRAQSTAQKGASGCDDNGSGSVFRWVAPGVALGIAVPASAGGGSSTEPLTLAPVAGSPPEHGSPSENASWWKSLRAQEQRRVIREHPEWIGNRDGVPFAARDEANRGLLGVDRARLVAIQARLSARLSGSWLGGTLTNDDAALAHVEAKLASLKAVEQTLARDGDRQLLVLDLSQERAQAAIARGDVDSADNVAVFVPGLTANVNDSMKDYDHEMDQLQHRAELENKRANPAGDSTTATVTWIGYQAPQLGWDLIGDNSVADDHAAQAGAAKLVPFLRGIGAARDHDAHLSLLGHSYGSTTAGLALKQRTGVDDVVFFGSPGIGTDNVKDLSVPGGHTYYIEAAWDFVCDLGYFGIDPSHMDGIEHASAKASTIVDPMTGEIRHFAGVTGHDSYLVDDSTSQYNMSVVVAGVPDRRVSDPGEGLGDVLSWPIPGTYS
jgi:hypothetical protein